MKLHDLYMILNEAQLLETLELLRTRKGDSTSIEVKSAHGDVPQNLGSTLCAFANMPEGGTIILGVDERLGFGVTGVNDLAKLEQQVASIARQSVVPAVNASFQSFILEGKTVLVVRINPLPLSVRPARWEGRAYLRQSDGDYVMAAYEEQLIEAEKHRLHKPFDYDLAPQPNTILHDLHATRLSSFLDKVRLSSRLADLSDDEILRITRVVDFNTQSLTLAGLYALGRFPEQFDKGLCVTVANLPTASERQVNDLHTFCGSVAEILEQVMQWMQSNLKTQRTYNAGGHFVEAYELPLNAIRELVANALIHRDLGPYTLGIGKTIQIRLLPDRLVIQSPGGLRGVSIDQLYSEAHAQAAVNKTLYELAKRLSTKDGASVIEGEGGGIREVLRACGELGLAKPVFSDKGTEFTAILFRPVQAPSVPALSFSGSKTAALVLNKNAQLVLSRLADHGRATINDLSFSLGLSKPQVRYALKQLQAANLVSLIGKQGSRNSYYEMADTQSESS